MARNCPAEPTHGTVVPLETTTHKYGWHCPNQGHDGRPKSHPQGEAEQTRSFFTTAEVEAGKAS